MAEKIHCADERRPVDIVIANAGIGGRQVLAPRAGEPVELVRKIFDVNTFGVVNTLNPLLDRFIDRQSGHVVIVGSIAAHIGVAQAPAYSASKAAVRLYGESLRRLLMPHGVYVTNVSPGFVDTPMSNSLPFNRPFCLSPENAAKRIAQGILRRDREIIFPWQARLAVALSALVPTSLVDMAISAAARRLETDTHDQA